MSPQPENLIDAFEADVIALAAGAATPAVPSHAYRCDAIDPSEHCIICGCPQRHGIHSAYGVATPPAGRAELYARPAAPGHWSVGLMEVAPDGTRRLTESAHQITTAEAQRWLDARRAARAQLVAA